ncbi:class I SAM-dependent methyltransferase [Kiloniella laminariae]|uniref:Class I SAM-dependent methyltransferase n=1 Tax=Kiloniella laminariae TaxID=454162 RepID=A0ABT4LHD7_9PROT|nr:class I SAM-dependent methyltransferase [Kiloniella laminariae]MCZ4280509.1 class I SAM-dependent methyltransferase [Kiloniella laminariae]
MKSRYKELILPGGSNEALSYKSKVDGLGREVIGSSCIVNDPAAKYYDSWVYLPSINDDNFLAQLQKIVADYQVSSIFCPHAVIYKKIAEIRASGKLDVAFSNAPPWEVEVNHIRSLYRSAKEVSELAASLRDRGSTGLPLLEEIAGLLMYSGIIPGMTSDEKLAAFISIYPELPTGDVVEIGAYRGRSSYFLAWASQKYSVGNVLVVDPWDLDHARQESSPEIIQDRQGELVKWEPVFEGFLAALSPFIGGINYLRMPSTEGAALYRTNAEVTSPLMGTTKYSGQIALIHIDGNHDYHMVLQDCAAWLDMVMPGGWIVFDDYIWLHGDGPRRAGDEFLIANADRIERSFVCDKSLFIHLIT